MKTKIIENTSDLLVETYVKSPTGSTELLTGIDENGNILVGIEKVPFTKDEFVKNFKSKSGEDFVFATESLESRLRSAMDSIELSAFADVQNAKRELDDYLLAHLNLSASFKEWDCLICKVIESARAYERVATGNFKWE